MTRLLSSINVHVIIQGGFFRSSSWYHGHRSIMMYDLLSSCPGTKICWSRLLKARMDDKNDGDINVDRGIIVRLWSFRFQAASKAENVTRSTLEDQASVDTTSTSLIHIQQIITEVGLVFFSFYYHFYTVYTFHSLKQHNITA